MLPPDESGSAREQEARQTHEATRSQTGSACPSCGAEVDAAALFCAECGADLPGQTTACPRCGENSAGENCSFCGAFKPGHPCGKCGAQGYDDFCASCGEPCTDLARQMFAENTSKTLPGPAPMSDQEAQAIVQELRSSLHVDVLREQEKLRQRIILTRERAYFQEREARIESFVQAHGRKIIQPNPEELQKARQFAERIGQFVQLENKRIAEAERRERKRQEEEAEQQRRANEEEARQRRALREEQERRAVQQAYWSRVAGVWVATSGQLNATMQITQSGSGAGGQIHWVQHDGYERVDTFAGTWNGNTITIHSTRMREIWKPPNVIAFNFSYGAIVSSDGDTMAGYIQSAAYWHEVFVRGG